MEVLLAGPDPAAVQHIAIPVGRFGTIPLALGRYSIMVANRTDLALMPDRLEIGRTEAGRGAPREIVFTLYPAAPLTIRSEGKVQDAAGALPYWFQSVDPPGLEFRVTAAEMDRPRPLPVGTWRIPDDDSRFSYEIAGTPDSGARTFRVAASEPPVVVLRIRRRPSDPFVFEVEFVDPDGRPIPGELVTQARVTWGPSLLRVMAGGHRDRATVFSTSFPAIRVVTLPVETPTTRLKHEWSKATEAGARVDLGPLPHGHYRIIVVAPELGTAQTEFEVGPAKASPRLRFGTPAPALVERWMPPGRGRLRQ